MTVKEIGYISAKVTRNTIVTILPSYRIQKRILDICLALLLLALMTIPMLLVALLIKLNSKGKVLYFQNRVGLNQEIFRIVKFRTLITCDSDQSFKQVVCSDSRITSLGHYLRVLYIDELPNLYNVLKGQMSIVGPRPHAVMMDSKLRQDYNQYAFRYKVIPGITGLAQIRGFKGQTDSYESIIGRIKSDSEYVEECNILLDFKIIISTIKIIFQDFVMLFIR